MDKKKLKKIFVKYLKIKDVSSAVTGKGNWDSLNHLNIIMEIENKFKIKFSTSEIQTTNSFKKFILLIKNKKK